MEHAKLSPSASHQWINCPGAPALCATVVETQDPEPSIQGTAVHHIGETALAGWYGDQVGPTDPATIFPAGSTVKFKYGREMLARTVTQEMLTNAKIYVDRIWTHLLDGMGGTIPGTSLELEIKLNLTHIRPNMFGYSDAIITKPDELVVADYKNGFVPVFLVGNPDALLFGEYESADLNPQLMIYGCGAAEAALWIPRTITLEIVQPRSMEVPPVQSVTIPADFLYDWQQNVLKPAANAADMPDAPLKAGEWCRWCKARGVCPELRDYVGKVAQVEFAKYVDPLPAPLKRKKAAQLSNQELSEIMACAPVIKSFLQEVHNAAFARALKGQKFHGMKLVATEKNRSWREKEENRQIGLLMAAYLGIEESSIERFVAESQYNEPYSDLANSLIGTSPIKSPAQVEELGAIWKPIVKQFSVREPGGYKLVPEAARGAEIVPAEIEFAEYAADVVEVAPVSVEDDPFSVL